MATKNNSIISPEYLNFKDEITARIRSAQYEALKAGNREMIALYWKKEFPGIKGFGVSNMWDMARFYAEYRSDEILQPLVGEISWSKHIVILTKCKETQQRQFYILATKKYGWTKYLHRAIFSVVKKHLFGDKTSVDMASQDIERERFSVSDRRKHTSRCFIQSEAQWMRNSCA